MAVQVAFSHDQHTNLILLIENIKESVKKKALSLPLLKPLPYFTTSLSILPKTHVLQGYNINISCFTWL